MNQTKYGKFLCVILSLLFFLLSCKQTADNVASNSDDGGYLHAIHMKSASDIHVILHDKLKADSVATAFKFTSSAPQAHLIENVDKWRLSTEVEGETPCWAWLDGTTIYCYAKDFTDKGKKLPLESAEKLFYNCKTLEEIDLHLFDTSRCTDMSMMFFECTALKTLDVTGFDTSNVTNMMRMFGFCSSLESVDVTHFDTRSIGKGELNDGGYVEMFDGCTSLKEVDITDFRTDKNANMSSMFRNCSSLTKFRKDSANVFQPCNMESMFTGCSSLVANAGSSSHFNADWFDTSKVTSMANLFRQCSKIESLNLDRWDVSNVASMKNMFGLCVTLICPFESAAIYWDTSRCADMSGMFGTCYALNEIAESLANFDTRNVVNMSSMFSFCTALTELDVSSWNVSKVTDMTDMFWGCSELKTIYASDAFNGDWRKLQTSEGGVLEFHDNMFTECNAIIGKGANGDSSTGYDSSVTDIEGAHFGGLGNDPGYFTKK
ncbi:MAG: BspA family leucine-rich repeat surface protein [Treponema sp.]|nr:BspA family leucine-rich repeat surface protein [Treponema sp.]